MTLRGKLYTLFGITLVLTCALTAAALLENTISELREEITDSAESSLILTAHAIRESAEREGHITVAGIRDEIERNLGAQPFIIGVVVSLPESQGGLLHFDLRDGSDPFLPEVGSANTRELTVPLPVGEARLVAYLDDTITTSVRRRLAGTFVVSAVLATMVSLSILSWGTEHLVARPLNRLRRQVEGVTGGRLDMRLGKLKERGDELGALARALQEMVDALNHAHAENQALIEQMRASNRMLDQRVEEATAELRCTHARLGDAHARLEDAHAALLETTEQLSRQERLAALGQLSGTIAHELGTPLSTISGHLELLLMGELSIDAREAISVAHQEALRMTEIIRRVLSSTRGKGICRESVLLGELVEQCIGLVMHPGDPARIRVLAEIDPAAGSPWTDRGLVRQVLINLITNARDALGGEGQILVRAERHGPWLRLSVDDDGPGVPWEARKAIFEPFYTTKAPDAGTGLGLAICYEIARSLGGRLVVDDAPLGGARFSLCVPGFDVPEGAAEVATLRAAEA